MSDNGGGFWLDRLWAKHWRTVLLVAWSVMVLLLGAAIGRLWGCG